MGRYSAPLDAQYDRGSIAFAFAIEHLGTREILPNAAGNRLRFTGKGEPFLFAAGDSAALQEAAAAATKRRKLDRTAVLQGLGLPTPGQVPPVCSMGGLGTFFHPKLIPTLAMISGPWSLYAPSFRESAIDYGRMRSQLLAVGDSVLALDGLSREQIAGDYLSDARAASRRERPPVRPRGTRSSRRGPDTRTSRLRGARALPSASAAITQPPQPKSGPGGSDYTHHGWRVSAGGTGYDAWYVFEPVRPRPRKAPLAVVMHGYGEYAGYNQMYEFIRHTVRKGSIVIYPRWQTDIATPVPRADQHRAVHEVVAARDPRRTGVSAGAAEEAGAAGPPANELLRVLVRRDHHREPHEPVSQAAPAEAAGDLARGPARRCPDRVRRARRGRLPARASRRP